MKYSHIFIFIVIAITFVVGLWLYPQMPERMASHWNIQGEVDGYLPKFWGIFLFPMIMAGLAILFEYIIPRIDPFKKNYESFRKYYDGFVVALILFLVFIYKLTILWSLGLRFDIGQLITPAIGALFYYIGSILPHVKRNWFMGIRTPWTMSSDSVWEKTHKRGGMLFKAAGIIIILSILTPKLLFPLILIPAIGIAVYLIAYSYLLYRKEKTA